MFPRRTGGAGPIGVGTVGDTFYANFEVGGGPDIVSPQNVGALQILYLDGFKPRLAQIAVAAPNDAKLTSLAREVRRTQWRALDRVSAR